MLMSVKCVPYSDFKLKENLSILSLGFLVRSYKCF